MQIEQVIEYLKRNDIVSADIGVIFGTGMGESFLAEIEIEKSLDYKDIPGFPIATVEFHSGKLHYGKWKGKRILVMKGRFHYYEGHTMEQITLPIRVLNELGIEYLLMSNAAGNLNVNWNKGDLMLVTDHINLQPSNPLRGPHQDRLGPRFPDMSAPYSPKLNDLLQTLAAAKNIELHTGVYAAVMGPNLETRAEYKFLQYIGADAVGMSTVPEVIVAVQLALPCCVVSILTDDCHPESLQPISITDVMAIVTKADKPLAELYLELIAQL